VSVISPSARLQACPRADHEAISLDDLFAAPVPLLEDSVFSRLSDRLSRPRSRLCRPRSLVLGQYARVLRLRWFDRVKFLCVCAQVGDPLQSQSLQQALRHDTLVFLIIFVIELYGAIDTVGIVNDFEALLLYAARNILSSNLRRKCSFINLYF
jgi:hypothetical protein